LLFTKANKEKIPNKYKNLFEEEVNIISQAKLETRKVPVISIASCGKWKDFIDLDYPAGRADRYELSDSDDSHSFYIIAAGDSMTGMITDKKSIVEGDFLLVEPSKEVRNGDIVFAKDPDLGTTIKKYYVKNDQIILMPLNDKYPPIIPTPDERLRVFPVTEIKRKLR
jgi:SOS-response transcriptional repressor LexA